MKVETVEQLAERIADMAQVFGPGRTGFVEDMEGSIFQAVEQKIDVSQASAWRRRLMSVIANVAGLVVLIGIPIYFRNPNLFWVSWLPAVFVVDMVNLKKGWFKNKSDAKN